MPEFTPKNVLLSDSRTGAVPKAQGTLILQDVLQNSKIMQLGKYIEMTDAAGKPVMEKEFTYLAEGPGAYWVGEAEKIQTSAAKWLKAKIVAKKLAVIIPVSREFLTYSVPDFFDQVRPLIAEAFHKTFDAAGILNVKNPFAQSIEQSVTASTTAVTGEITFDNLLALEDKIIDNGFEANAFISKVENRSALRKAVKNENGVQTVLYDRAANTLDGRPIADLKLTEMKKGTIYAGNFDHLYYGIPYTLTYAISEDATLSTIKNADNSDVNLFEQDMIALRAVMDVGLMITKDKAFAKLAPVGV